AKTAKTGKLFGAPICDHAAFSGLSTTLNVTVCVSLSGGLPSSVAVKLKVKLPASLGTQTNRLDTGSNRAPAGRLFAITIGGRAASGSETSIRSGTNWPTMRTRSPYTLTFGGSFTGATSIVTFAGRLPI